MKQEDSKQATGNSRIMRDHRSPEDVMSDRWNVQRSIFGRTRRIKGEMVETNNKSV